MCWLYRPNSMCVMNYVQISSLKVFHNELFSNELGDEFFLSSKIIGEEIEGFGDKVLEVLGYIHYIEIIYI